MATLEPFHVPATAIGEHFEQVREILRGFLDASVDAHLGIVDLETRIVAGLQGAGMEVTARNRGRHLIRVAPLLHLRDGLWAWLGYQEEWSHSPGGGTRRVFFRSSSVGIHFGYRHMDPKPQIFRAEWAGYDLKGGQYRFQGGRAGHPHWQFDAVESLVSDEDTNKAADLAALLREEAGGRPPPDFSPQGLGLAPADIHSMVSSRKIAAMHFASASQWWRDPIHAHVPANVMNIRTWLKRTLDYVIQELDRA